MKKFIIKIILILVSIILITGCTISNSNRVEEKGLPGTIENQEEDPSDPEGRRFV